MFRAIFRAAFMLLISASLAAGQETAQVESRGHPFIKAETKTEGASSSFEFEMSGYRYIVKSNGAGRRTKRNETRLFNLRLGGRDSIESAYFAEYKSNVILVCAVGDGETGAGFVVRLEQPSMRTLWKRDLPGFNIAVPVRDDADLYVAGNGFVARLNLKNGQFVWMHESLDSKGGDDSFDSFAAPELSGEEVLFREATVYNRTVRVIRVNRRTGRITRIE